MTKLAKLFLLFTSILFVTFAYAYSQPEGSDDGSSGFGGTGHSSSGFGGTGIIGTITDFGSIWVNGIEIGYGESTKISSDLHSSDSLKLGQQVILETEFRNDKTLTKHIHIYYPLAGQITRIEKNQLMINNQFRVQITAEMRSDNALKLNVGGYIAVNGYQTKDGWVATRISQNYQQKTFYHPLPTREFSDKVNRVVIETNAQQVAQWTKLSINNSDKALQHNERVIINGHIRNQQIKAEKIEAYQVQMLQLKQQNMQQNRSERELRGLQQDQREMMQLQREQKSMMQDQIEQQRQLQELKDQMDQIQNMKN